MTRRELLKLLVVYADCDAIIIDCIHLVLYFIFLSCSFFHVKSHECNMVAHEVAVDRSGHFLVSLEGLFPPMAIRPST